MLSPNERAAVIDRDGFPMGPVAPGAGTDRSTVVAKALTSLRYQFEAV
jgi:hypothetical protein